MLLLLQIGENAPVILVPIDRRDVEDKALKISISRLYL